MKCPKLLQCCALSKSLLQFPAGFVHGHACPDEVRGNILTSASCWSSITQPRWGQILHTGKEGREGGRESQHGEPARIPGGGRSRSRWWLTRNRLKQLVRKQDVVPRVGSDPKQIVPSRARAWLGKEKPALISSSTRGDWSCVPHLSRAQITWGVALGGAGGGGMSSLCVGEINFLSHPLQQCSWVMKCPNPACARHTNLSFSCPSMNAPGRGWILGAGIPCCRAWHGWTQCASQGTEPAPTLRTPFHLGNSAVAQAF